MSNNILIIFMIMAMIMIIRWMLAQDLGKLGVTELGKDGLQGSLEGVHFLKQVILILMKVIKTRTMMVMVKIKMNRIILFMIRGRKNNKKHLGPEGALSIPPPKDFYSIH